MINPLWTHYKRDVVFVATVLLLAGLLLGLQLNRFLTVVNHDAAIFCILGQSILKGHYLLVSEPNPQPYFTFPPFFPLQLAGLMLLFHNTDTAAMQPVFKGYMGLLFLLSLPLYYLWARRLLGQRHAMALTALVAVNPLIFKYIADVLSDVPYWAFSMGAVFAMWQRQQSLEAMDGKSRRWTVVAIVLIVFSALTRQIGLALVLTFLLATGLKRQWRTAGIALVVFLLSIGGWQSYEHFYRLHHPSAIDSLNQQGVQQVLDKSPIKLEYVKHFLVDRPVDKDKNRSQANPSVLLGNIQDRFLRYSELGLDQVLPPIKYRQGEVEYRPTHLWPFLLLVIAPFFYGLYRLWQAFPFGALYIGLYMGVLLVYPYISPRFLLPVFPLMLVCLYWGWWQFSACLNTMDKPALQRAAALILPGFLALALTTHLLETVRRVKDGFELKMADAGPSLRQGNRAYYETLLWIGRNLPEDSLVISRKPPVTYFYSGRKSTAYPFTSHADELFSYIEQKQTLNPDLKVYVFQDTVFGSSSAYLKPAVENHAGRFQLIYTEPQTGSRVWRLLPPKHP